MREVSNQYRGIIRLVVVNTYTEAGEQQAERLGVRGHPALLYVDSTGKERLRRYGPQTKEQLQHSFEALANAP